MADSPDTLIERFSMIGALFETGVLFKRMQIRRASPNLSDEEVEQQLGEWLRDGPEGKKGDAEGRVIPWPRR